MKHRFSDTGDAFIVFFPLIVENDSPLSKYEAGIIFIVIPEKKYIIQHF